MDDKGFSREAVLAFLDKLIFVLLFIFLFCSAFSIALSEIGYFSALTLWIGRMIYAGKSDVPVTSLDGVFLGYVAAEIIATVFADRHLYSLLYLERRMLLLPIVYILAASVY